MALLFPPPLQLPLPPLNPPLLRYQGRQVGESHQPTPVPIPPIIDPSSKCRKSLSVWLERRAWTRGKSKQMQRKE